MLIIDTFFSVVIVTLTEIVVIILKKERKSFIKIEFLSQSFDLVFVSFSLLRNGAVNDQNVDSLYDSSVCIGLCVNVNCEYFICFDG